MKVSYFMILNDSRSCEPADDQCEMVLIDFVFLFWFGRHVGQTNSLVKYIKIASLLNEKTVRDVALRVRWMTVSVSFTPFRTGQSRSWEWLKSLETETIMVMDPILGLRTLRDF